MARIALGIEYDGSRYHGWQTQQAGVVTIQPLVEGALARVADHPVAVTCAGRTDRGVHATCQVVHFDTEAVRNPYSWVMGANSHLPSDIAVRWAHPVSEEFNARFSARSRSYRYVICNSATRPALYRKQLSWQYRSLDVELMREATTYLLGTHDFSSFRGAYCQAKSPVKTLYQLDLQQWGSLLVLEVRADAFLMHMVRNIVGVLYHVGLGKAPPAWVGEVVSARQRSAGAATAPPWGLYLVGVEYPSTFGLPETPLGPVWLPAAF